jgi:hypothetical protein
VHAVKSFPSNWHVPTGHESPGAGAKKLILAGNPSRRLLPCSSKHRLTSCASNLPACDIRMQPHWRVGSCQTSLNNIHVESRRHAFCRLRSVIMPWPSACRLHGQRICRTVGIHNNNNTSKRRLHLQCTTFPNGPPPVTTSTSARA